jgi:hypothetical protein
MTFYSCHWEGFSQIRERVKSSTQVPNDPLNPRPLEYIMKSISRGFRKKGNPQCKVSKDLFSSTGQSREK